MANDNKTYNGWTNYETWNVALWIDNERSSHEFWREQSQDCMAAALEVGPIKADDVPAEQRHLAAVSLSERLKGSFEDDAPELTGTYADLLNGALSEVNWYEIAKHLIEQHIEIEAYEETN